MADNVHSRSLVHLELLGMAVLGLVLRAYRLGYWSISGDEVHTLRDSIGSAWMHSEKPLLFFLNAYLVGPWLPLDEFGLRLLPAIFGIAAIPVMYSVVRPILGWRAGLIAAFLVAIHPWHLYWSQFARYYSLVFLLTAFLPLALYYGLEHNRIRWLAGAAVAGLLSVLAHPSAVLVIGAVGLWLVAYLWKRLAGTAEQRRLRMIGLSAVLLIGTVAVVRFGPMLVSWGSGRAWGHSGVVLILSYLDWQTLTLAALGFTGLVWLWRDGNAWFAGLLAAVLFVPLGFLAIATQWIAVSTGYLFATAPALIIGAAFFFDRLFALDIALWQRRLLFAGCAGALLAAFGPRIVSQYLDGGRLDFRAAAQSISERGSGEDLVLSDQALAMRHYLPGMSVEFFERDDAALAAAYSSLAPGKSLWVVASILARGGFREIGLDAAADWMLDHCRLSATHVIPRLDYKRNELRVYSCPARVPAET